MIHKTTNLYSNCWSCTCIDNRLISYSTPHSEYIRLSLFEVHPGTYVHRHNCNQFPSSKSTGYCQLLMQSTNRRLAQQAVVHHTKQLNKAHNTHCEYGNNVYRMMQCVAYLFTRKHEKNGLRGVQGCLLRPSRGSRDQPSTDIPEHWIAERLAVFCDDCPTRIWFGWLSSVQKDRNRKPFQRAPQTAAIPYTSYFRETQLTQKTITLRSFVSNCHWNQAILQE